VGARVRVAIPRTRLLPRAAIRLLHGLQATWHAEITAAREVTAGTVAHLHFPTLSDADADAAAAVVADTLAAHDVEVVAFHPERRQRRRPAKSPRSPDGD
jgi:hypothetical protein